MKRRHRAIPVVKMKKTLRAFIFASSFPWILTGCLLDAPAVKLQNYYSIHQIIRCSDKYKKTAIFVKGKLGRYNLKQLKI
jgi:hypothetical protein